VSQFAVGQRYISNLDASLGLGMISAIEGRRISLYFPACQEERHYASDQAALTRIIYQVGDSIETLDGEILTVNDVLDNQGLIIYQAKDDDGDRIVPETELTHSIQFSQAKQRLLNGLVDSPKAYALRAQGLSLKQHLLQSSALGLLGPRVQLLPHQLYIAQRVAERAQPRVLLADEVGLGKTIEAGLIIHQQISKGSAERVLIIVPDSLLHQWLVEMLRRFNLSFSILDEEMCFALGESYENPFEANQLTLCPLSLFTKNEDRLDQAAETPWDLLVVDEAHHLAWSEEDISFEYQVVETLSEVSRGLLLLTATPEQAGIESHFARLRLLDPDRYFDLASFIEEENQYKDINQLLEKVQGETFESLPTALENLLSDAELNNIKAYIDEANLNEAKQHAINCLLDRHGTGRVLFRNTRQAVTGFPKRSLVQHPLILDDPNITHGAKLSSALQIESLFGSNWLKQDARIDWLLDFLQSHRDKKILLICAQAATAIDLEEQLRIRHSINACVFHEHMSLIQRDRAAAYFADPDEGAQVLICSEIGSEGRNFQFASELILFDLPLNPDLLEQRIGRLDRIGQLNDIQIHVPYYQGTAQHALLRWYHEGLNAIEKTCSFGHHLFAEFHNRIQEVLQQEDQSEIDSLIQDTHQAASHFRQNIESERNRLLELNSCRHEEAELIIDAMLDVENRPALQSFVESFCDQFGIEIEAHSANTIILRQGDHQRVTIPMLNEEGFTATYSRETALSRDDIQFLNWEHPFIQEAFDILLNNEHGNTNISTIKLKGIPAGSILMEGLFSIQSTAPKRLQLQRYLPNTTIRVLVNLQGKDLAALLSEEKLNGLVNKIPKTTALAMIKKASDAINVLCEKAENCAQQQLPELLNNAKALMHHELQDDIVRMEALQSINNNISDIEITYMRKQEQALADALEHASLSTEALRLVIAT